MRSRSCASEGDARGACCASVFDALSCRKERGFASILAEPRLLNRVVAGAAVMLTSCNRHYSLYKQMFYEARIM